MKENKKIGFTIGKFAPLHKGHQFLIETALKEMDKMIVIVYDTDLIDIPTEKRAEWIKELYPNVEIKYGFNPPKQYGLDDESVKIQMEYLTKIIGDERPTHFYSSEKYGASVAKYMNLVDRRVDNEREIVPIRATIVRENLDENKKWIEPKVYDDCKKIN
ncbi:MAG: adenylyltransferase/cytidyltransferase family protein [Clostridia bacterium]|nr:adenylyltransferase/cytidyltransferase family protein [Clostridia bacterium]